MNFEKVKVLPQEELEELIEPTIFERLSKDSYTVYKTNPEELLTHNRFGLAFKIIFLQMLDCCYEYGEEVYLEHIKAFSYGTFTEPHNKKKVGKNKFIETFLSLYNEIDEKGFNPKKSILPLSSREHIKNGAHRLAAAIYANKKVYCIKTENKGSIFDYKFFYDRNVRPEFIDAAATTFAAYSSNCYIALVWPSAQGAENEIQKSLKSVVYRKEISLNDNGAKNLLSQVYAGENWLGTIENDFAGVYPKLNSCFNTKAPLRAYLFQADSLDEVKEIKDSVRKIFNLDKHSIHITDTIEEVNQLTKLLFNDQAIHFLNNARPNKYKSFHKKLNQFREYITVNGINAEDIVLDSGMVMSLYGLRESNDVDYLLKPDIELPKEDGIFSNHLDFLKFYNHSVERLIYDPRNYFYYMGIKFLNLQNVYEFKKNRGGNKDLNDTKLIEALLDNNSQKMKLARFKQKINFIKSGFLYKIEKFAGNTLRTFGLYHLINKFYSKFKR